MSAIEAKLEAMGITLPAAAAPAANYVATRRTGNLLFVSGQLPMAEGKVAYTGQVGAGVSMEDGVEAARLCAINILAQAKTALGDLDAIASCIKLGGFVNCETGFGDQPKVINGASDLIADVFGEAGRHARFAVGAPGLPFDAAVEVEAIFELR